MRRSAQEYEFVDTGPTLITIPPGKSSMAFYFNDYPGAYHDNSECISIHVDKQVGTEGGNRLQGVTGRVDTINVCAKLSEGIAFKGVPGVEYELTATGTWRGKEGDVPFGPEGSGRIAKKTLRADYLPAGALIMSKDGRVWELLGTGPKLKKLAKGERFIFLFNDIPDAYHDNKDCVVVTARATKYTN